MRKVLLVLLVGALTLAAAACSSGSDDDAGDAGGGSVDGGQAVMEEEAAADVGAAESGGGEDAVAVAQESAVPSVGPRVIQTASMTLSVPRNDFQKVVDRARSYATSSGGFVVEYSASQSGDERRLVRGNLVLRVPERSYSRVMKQLSDLGRVEGSEEAGQDVCRSSSTSKRGNAISRLSRASSSTCWTRRRPSPRRSRCSLSSTRCSWTSSRRAAGSSTSRTRSPSPRSRSTSAAAGGGGGVGRRRAVEHRRCLGHRRARVRDRGRLDPDRGGHDRPACHPARPCLPRRPGRLPARHPGDQADAERLASGPPGYRLDGERPGRPLMAKKRSRTRRPARRPPLQAR